MGLLSLEDGDLDRSSTSRRSRTGRSSRACKLFIYNRLSLGCVQSVSRSPRFEHVLQPLPVYAGAESDCRAESLGATPALRKSALPRAADLPQMQPLRTVAKRHDRRPLRALSALSARMGARRSRILISRRTVRPPCARSLDLILDHSQHGSRIRLLVGLTHRREIAPATGLRGVDVGQVLSL